MKANFEKAQNGFVDFFYTGYGIFIESMLEH